MLGCLGRSVALLLLFLLLFWAWQVGPGARGGLGARGEPSMALASEALDRYQHVVEGVLTETAFSETEMESLLRYRLPDQLPGGVESPTIRFRDGEAWIGIRVPLSLIPPTPPLDAIRVRLPATVPAELRGTLVTRSGEEVLFLVHRILIAGVPLPRALFPEVIETIDPRERRDVPSGVLSLPLPAGIHSLYIDGDSLVLLGEPIGRD